VIAVIDATAARMGSGITYVRGLLAALAAEADSNHTFYIMACHSQHYLYSDLPSQFRWLWIDLLSEKTLVRLLWQQFALPGLLRCLGADLLYALGGTAPAQCLCALVIAFQNVKPFLPVSGVRARFKELGRRSLARHAARRADRMLFVSDFSRQLISHALALPKERTATVYHGLDDRFRPTLKPGMRSTVSMLPRPYILAVSSIAEHKNYPALVSAFSRFLQLTGATCYLVIVGGVGEPAEYKRLCRLVVELGIEHRVFFAGPITHESLPSVYAAADIFVFPSRFESFGMPLIEAMACGVPVAASKTTAIPEVCGDAALYFDPADVEQMALAIARLSEDADLRAELARRGLDRARLFTWSRTAKQTLQLFEAAVRDHKMKG